MAKYLIQTDPNPDDLVPLAMSQLSDYQVVGYLTSRTPRTPRLAILRKADSPSGAARPWGFSYIEDIVRQKIEGGSCKMTFCSSDRLGSIRLARDKNRQLYAGDSVSELMDALLGAAVQRLATTDDC